MKSRTSSALVLAGLLLLALNLRPAAVSVGPVLTEVRTSLHMSSVAVSLLTSLSVLAFAVFGALAPTAARRLGLHRVILLALVAVGVGLLGRALTGSGTVFLLLSALALAGMALANVLLPSLVKRHFPDRIGTVTALYTTVLATGLTASLTLTVPVAESTSSGWRAGIGVWAVFALVAVLPWLVLVRHDRAPEAQRRRLGYLQVLRTPIGAGLALFFGLQSMQAYIGFNWLASVWRDNGYTAAQAGLLVGIVAVLGIPLSLTVPRVAARVRDLRPLMTAIILGFPLGYACLLLAPHTLAVPAAVLLGIGGSCFPLVLVLIGLRARTPDGTAALSSVAQSSGYLIAFLGPFGFGVLHGVTGEWTASLLASILLTVPLLVLGLLVSKPSYLEDQLAR